MPCAVTLHCHGDVPLRFRWCRWSRWLRCCDVGIRLHRRVSEIHMIFITFILWQQQICHLAIPTSLPALMHFGATLQNRKTIFIEPTKQRDQTHMMKTIQGNVKAGRRHHYYDNNNEIRHDKADMTARRQCRAPLNFASKNAGGRTRCTIHKRMFLSNAPWSRDAIV